MTFIVEFKYKKDLKEAVENKQDFSIEDPSFINPHSFMASEIIDDQVIAVTNHPKRSWFAQIIKEGGDLQVK